MSTRYKETDRRCPKCGGKMQHVMIKNDDQDDHGDVCLECPYEEVRVIPYKGRRNGQ